MDDSGDTTIINSYSAILSKIEKKMNSIKTAQLTNAKDHLVAVSKTFDIETIEPILKAGQRIFGENRVQEAQFKWPFLKEKYKDSRLHLIGPLQTNKVKQAVGLFDAIQTLDRPKLAVALAKEMLVQQRQLDLHIQVNTGAEVQKAGVSLSELEDFFLYCRDELGLSVVGLMCIPPRGQNPRRHFEVLATLASKYKLPQLSMGMSADFEMALDCGATHVRVGSAIFGTR